MVVAVLTNISLPAKYLEHSREIAEANKLHFLDVSVLEIDVLEVDILEVDGRPIFRSRPLRTQASFLRRLRGCAERGILSQYPGRRWRTATASLARAET